MKYFKLTDNLNAIIEYVKVLDTTTEVKAKTDTVLVEEISEEEYNTETNQLITGFVAHMPTIDFDDQ